MLSSRTIALAGLASAALLSAAGISTATAAAPSAHLDLGPANLPETRTTETLQPGVTLTRITRGAQRPALRWTLEVAHPVDRHVAGPRRAAARDLRQASAHAAGGPAAQQGIPGAGRAGGPAAQPPTCRAGVLGYRVRVGSYPSKAAADQDRAELSRGGGEREQRLHRLGRRPRPPAALARQRRHASTRARSVAGSGASYGPDLYNRETTSALARPPAPPSASTPATSSSTRRPARLATRPAPACTAAGCCPSPSTGRPALVLHDDARHTDVDRLRWAAPRTSVDGRTPTGRHRPGAGPDPQLRRGRQRHAHGAAAARHDLHRRQRAGRLHPAVRREHARRAGREVVVEPTHRVAAVLRRPRHGARRRADVACRPPATACATLGGVRVGDRVVLTVRAARRRGPPVRATAADTIVNGGPLLVRNGREDITQARDGFVHPGDPSFAYGSFVKRNPRTFAGVDAQGRTVLVTVDGRSTDDLGLSHPGDRRRGALAGSGRRDQPRRRGLDGDGGRRAGHPTRPTRPANARSATRCWSPRSAEAGSRRGARHPTCTRRCATGSVNGSCLAGRVLSRGG